MAQITSIPVPTLPQPEWLQTAQVVFDLFSYLEQGRDQYGDIFMGQFIGFSNFLVVSDPEAIATIFATDSQYFDLSSNSQILHPIIGDRSLLSLNGLAHRQRRKLLMPPFHGERLHTYGQHITTIVEKAIGDLSRRQSFLVRPLAQDITLRVILRTVFGVDRGPRFDQLRTLLSTLLNGFESALGASQLFFPFLQQDWGIWSPWGWLMHLQQQIDELIYAEIRDRRSQPLQDDILSLLIQSRDENGQPMSDLELRDELMALLFGGHETTASAITWAMYWIHRHPQVKANLLDELNQSTEPIYKRPYLHAVCSETLRIQPMVAFAFSRALVQPMRLLHYDLQPGLILTPCIYLVHHRPDLYPQPKQFRPERFLERQFAPSEFFPFGGGDRRCLGHAFALFEMKIVLATILKSMRLSLVSDCPERPMRRSITFTPRTGIPMRIQRD